MKTTWRSSFAIKDQALTAETCPTPQFQTDPFSHLDVREKLGLRAGGFGLLISQGMVDEMRYNDLGNEVILIKRFAESRTP